MTDTEFAKRPQNNRLYVVLSDEQWEPFLKLVNEHFEGNKSAAAKEALRHFYKKIYGEEFPEDLPRGFAAHKENRK